MSRFVKVRVVMAVVCGALAAGACGSSTPTGLSPQSWAQYLDSAVAQNPGAAVEWSNALGLAVDALSWGVSPTTLQISVNGAATTFQMVAWDDYAFDPSAGLDSTIHLAAWSGGLNPVSVLRIDAMFRGKEILTYVEYASDPMHGTVSPIGAVQASLALLKGKCHPGSGVDTAFAADCKLAEVLAAFDVEAVLSDTTHLVMPSRAVNAMRQY